MIIIYTNEKCRFCQQEINGLGVILLSQNGNTAVSHQDCFEKVENFFQKLKKDSLRQQTASNK